MTEQDAKASNVIIQGTLSLISRDVRVLYDSRAI